MKDATHDPSDLHDGSVALEPERAYDLPAAPHMGHGASLRVPVSEGPSSFVLDQPELMPHRLMAEEPPCEPARQMELGTDWTDRVTEAAHHCDRPIHPPAEPWILPDNPG